MKIVQITPGAGESFYCENCLRDHALVRAMRRLGHDVTMVPLYLPPLSNDGPPDTSAAPIFFGGINVYLQQKSALFRRTPRWLDRLLDARWLLRWAGRRTGLTDPELLGQTTISMLRGEDGRQVKELERLVEFLLQQGRADVVVLSNAMLMGLAPRIRRALGCGVVCLLQDEEGFLVGLGEKHQAAVWDLLRRQAACVDAFIAVSRFYADTMGGRLSLPPERLSVVYNGIDLEGYVSAPQPPVIPAIGFLSEMSQSKGLGTLVEAFVRLKRDPHHAPLRLQFAGGHSAGDDAFLASIRRRLEKEHLADQVEFIERFDRTAKQAFLPRLSLLAVPTQRPEASGLYLLEALAAGVPVVMPDHGSMRELVAATGGGLLHKPNNAADLAARMDELLRDPPKGRAMGRAGQEVVRRQFDIQTSARGMLAVYEKAATTAADGRGTGILPVRSTGVPPVVQGRDGPVTHGRDAHATNKSAGKETT